MTIADAMTEKAQKAVASLVPEPVLGVAFCNRCGTLDTIVARQMMVIASDLAGGDSGGGFSVPVDAIHRNGAKPTPLPPAFLLAVTPNRVHVYNIKMFMGRVSVKDELGVFDRRGLEVSVEDADLTTRFAMRSPTMGQGMAFEIMKSDYATSFGQLLRLPTHGQG